MSETLNTAETAPRTLSPEGCKKAGTIACSMCGLCPLAALAPRMPDATVSVNDKKAVAEAFNDSAVNVIDFTSMASGADLSVRQASKRAAEEAAKNKLAAAQHAKKIDAAKKQQKADLARKQVRAAQESERAAEVARKTQLAQSRETQEAHLPVKKPRSENPSALGRAVADIAGLIFGGSVTARAEK